MALFGLWLLMCLGAWLGWRIGRPWPGLILLAIGATGLAAIWWG